MVQRIVLGTLVVAVSALTLGACDNKEQKPKDTPKFQIELDKGAVAGSGLSLPKNMPAYAKVYPGADVIAVVDNKYIGVMVSYETSAPPDEVIAFHKKNIADAGLEIRHEAVIQGTTIFSAKKDKQTLSVTVAGQDGKTMVQLNY